MYIYDITSLNFSENENFWGKSCRESQNTRFTFGKVFPKIVSFVRLGFIAELFLFLKCYILRFHRFRLRNLQNIRFWHRIYSYAFIRHCILRIQSGYMVYEYKIFLQLHTKYYSISLFQGQLHMQRKLLGTISVSFDVTGQILIMYSAFVKFC
jgi:hypothetical protein